MALNGTSAKGFRFGRTRGSGGANFCAWLIPGALDRSTGRPVANSCSTATKQKVFHRRTVGRDFNTPATAGAAHDPSYGISVNASTCTGYYNYFTDSSYRTGRFRDPVRFKLPADGKYRYTSNDRRAAMIRVGSGDNGTTWLFVRRSCIDRQLKGQKLYNTND